MMEVIHQKEERNETNQPDSDDFLRKKKKAPEKKEVMIPPRRPAGCWVCHQVYWPWSSMEHGRLSYKAVI